MSNIKIEYGDLIAFHPGYYLNDVIEDMEISQNELAKRLETNGKTISLLLSGDISLSNELAKKLSQMLGTSVDVWIGLQKKYEEECCKIEQKKELELELATLKNLDYNYFSSINVVKSTKNKLEQIVNLRSYLKVSSLNVLKSQDLFLACRTSVNNVNEKNIINTNAWIQTGVNIAKSIKCSPFNGSKLKKHIDDIREMTKQPTHVFYPRLKEIFSSCGVAFFVLKYLPNSGINGAVKWLNKEKVLLVLNDRGKDADKFWFSLFHEIGHILQQKKRQVYVSINSKMSLGMADPESEKDADSFASNALVPEEKYSQFLSNKNFTYNAIREFANNIGIHECIVIGRLQHDRYIDWKEHSHCKLKYEIK